MASLKYDIIVIFRVKAAVRLIKFDSTLEVDCESENRAGTVLDQVSETFLFGDN